MTGYTVHTGSNEDFSSGWDRIFGDEDAKDAKKASGKKSPKAAKRKTGGRKPVEKTDRRKK